MSAWNSIGVDEKKFEAAEKVDHETVYDPTKSKSVRSILLARDSRADPRMIEYVEKIFETNCVGHGRVKRLIKMLISEIETDRIRQDIEAKMKESKDSKKKKKKPKERRYHMCLSGPDNIGKRLMAGLIARILRRLGIVKKRMFVRLRNTTFQKFTQYIDLAKGGVLFVEEANVLMSDGNDKAKIDKMEEILRKNDCIVIFSGAKDAMSNFFHTFPSIADLVPYKHFTFSPLSKAQFVEIFGMIAKLRKQILQEGALKAVRVMIRQIPKKELERDNCRCLTRLMDTAQKIRDARLSQLLAEDRPQLLRLLLVEDIKRAMMVEGYKYEVEDQRTVHEMLAEEFKKIVGLKKIKEKLKNFANTAERSSLREEQLGITSSKKERLHMIFSGPPGTGKTMMANLVAKILVKLDVVPSPEVITINKGADLCSTKANGTAANVDALVQRANGGVIFIDEAYTLTEAKAGTGKEAIESIMKHLDPPKCVFILAGYKVQMDEFLRQNDGLLRRVPYRFDFEPYNADELLEIVKVYAKHEKLSIDEKELKGIRGQLSKMSKKTVENRNASLAVSWVQAARREIDNRVDFESARKDPYLLTKLKAIDFQKAAESLKLVHSGLNEGVSVEQFLKKELDKVIGHDNIKKILRKIANRVARDRILREKGILKGMAKQAKYHMVFSGNPGTGKTYIAGLVSKLLLRLGAVDSDRVVTVPTGNALIDKNLGGTPDKVRAKVREAAGGCLMIDEAYTLTQELGPNAGSNVGAYGKQAVDTLMEFMDPPQVVLIFAGYEEQMNDFLRTNAGLKRRVAYFFRFKDYTVDELVQIFEVMAKGKNLTYDAKVPTELRKALGFVPPDTLSVRNAGVVKDIIERSVDMLSNRVSTEQIMKDPKSAMHIIVDDVKEAMVSLELAHKTSTDPKNASNIDEFMDKEFKKIIGHDGIKKMLRTFAKKVAADRKRADIMGKVGKRQHKDRYHMVFAGPPGTGKTMWAKMVAKILVRLGIVPHDEVSIVGSPLNLLAGFMGQTPAKVDHVVQQARGGVLFIDEAYQLMTKSASGGAAEAGAYQREAIDTLMKHMDPPKCVMIFAGYEHPMEEFLRTNEGIARRLYQKFVFKAYSKENLFDIFKVMLKSANEVLGDEKSDLLEVRKMIETVPESYTKDKNGGFVENWIQNSRLARDTLLDLSTADAKAFHTLRPEHLKIGLSQLKLRIEIGAAEDKNLDQWLKGELGKVVGCRNIKDQILRFRRQVAKDRLRRKQGKKIKGGELYHMIFSGPPGTGKTMIGKLMAKVMLKMGLVTNDRFKVIKNPQEMIDKYQGGTPHRVDHIVDQAKGGVIFIDEAYSIAQGGGRDFYASQAVNQIMAHLDPPTAVFIFAGYERPMKQFLSMNPGLERRIYYHYHFAPYSVKDLVKILLIQAKSMGKSVNGSAIPVIEKLLKQIPSNALQNENGGLTERWLRFASAHNDFRVPLEAARKDASLLDKLAIEDFVKTHHRLLPHKVRKEGEKGENASDHKEGKKTEDRKINRTASGRWKGSEPADIREEIKATFEEAFRLMDKNGDGFITPDEMMHQYGLIRKNGIAGNLEKDIHQEVLADFMVMDTDKDFKVSCQEYLDFYVLRGKIATSRADWKRKEAKVRESLGLPKKTSLPEVYDDEGEEFY